MKQLETTITSGGFTLTQIWRQGQAAVYRKEKEEAIIIKEHNATNFTLKTPEGNVTRKIEAGESYPSSEQWGRLGWTYTSEADAIAKAQSLLK